MIGSHRHIVFMGILALLGSFQLSAATVNPEKALSDKSNLNAYIEILTDSSYSIHIKDALSAPEIHWEAYDGQKLKPDHIYWAKLTFENNLPRVMSYFLYVGKNDYIDAFYVSNNEVIHHSKSGYLYTSSEKEIEVGSYYIPMMLSAKSKIDVYIRIEEGIHNSPEFKLQLYSGNNWANHMFGHYAVDITFQIFLWLMIFYSIFQYGASNIREYLFYSIYLFTVSLIFLYFTGMLREFILKSIPQLTIYFIPMPLVTFSGYWLLVISLLDLKKKLPTIERNIRNILIVNSIVIVLCVVSLFFIQNFESTTIVIQIITAGNFAYVLWFLYQISQAKHAMAKYYIGGTTLVVLLGIFELLTWDPENSTAEIMQLGFVVEIIIFSIGLNKKKKIIEGEKKKALDRQINQLKLNESLAQWQKEELEKIIDNRTQKIKSKNKDLKRAIAKANEAARVKSDFLSVMSHEIRTPMNAVIGIVHLLLSENPKKSQMDNLKTLKFSAENLLVLINDILDYSKVESGNIKLEHIPFDLRELTKSIGSTYETHAAENGIQFNILIDQNIPSTLKSDPARLTQILNNLISNAIKFTPKGEVKLLINMIKKTGSKVKVEFLVQDTGIGISKEKQELIFESFTQAHANTTRKYGGTGLGLAITKKLIALFDSYIVVESKPGEGSKFSFTMLLEEATGGIYSMEEDQSEKILSIKNRNVLIVDDNTINLMMAKKFVNKWGMNCETVESGKLALNAIFNDNYDLILMDLQMPEMDGYEVTETIRSLDSPDINNIPIIAVSADTFDNVQDKILEAGMNDFLSKPFNPNELLNLVHKYCASPITRS
ncbi:hybrid sensor histidine kinase/response regulator [Reichenbachiella versicolor]|uniref:hybrid sensor histidine kinase/response regulator n=1 Tax=Reichenbachiella versicolor TaxID=1821036 RepID=UPI000D6E1F45|nr:hybrid sensor histidine kinase/response regulator [Reichenbachiella versicolor]